MSKPKFATASFKSRETGATVTGEFVVESSNAWQVAVDGKVRVLLKDEWKWDATRRSYSDLANLLSDLIGNR